jgi:type VI secretion system protein ImpC
MNAAYAFAANMTRAYAETNWVSAIQGAGHGGGVDNLPACPMANSDDDPVCARSTEVIISVRRELELCNLGFLPLCHVKDPGASVFISAQTCQRPKTCEAQEPTADAAIAARLPCVMTISRFAHYLKCVSRDKSVLFVSRQEFQNCLNSWISELVLGEPGVSEEMKIRYPLAEAKITVEPLPGSPGRFRAVAQLRPHLPLGKLTTSLKVLVDLPRR